MNHQAALNKRICDQLREYQQTELQQAKERFDLEIQCFEELETLKANHTLRKTDSENGHISELYGEKEKLLSKHEREKLSKLEAEHAKEMKKLSHTHRQQLRTLKNQQEVRLNQKFRTAAEQSSNVAAKGHQSAASLARSKGPSTGGSRMGSSESLDQDDNMSDAMTSKSGGSVVINSAKNKFEAMQEEEETGESGTELRNEKVRNTIYELNKKHREAQAALLSVLKQELDECEMSIQARQRDLEESQELELQGMRSDHQAELENLTAIQEKEIQMEASVHDAEMRMLLERRILNSVLDTVVDGIINIDPIGTISRFNPAAEKMFGKLFDTCILTKNADK